MPFNNAAERALRGIALGRKSWLFAGSDRGGERAAAMYSLIVTCKLNGVDPRAWLADVLARLADYPASRLHELLPWNWREQSLPVANAAWQLSPDSPVVLAGWLPRLDAASRRLRRRNRQMRGWQRDAECAGLFAVQIA